MVVEYAPGSHAVQFGAPVREYVPGVHDWQVFGVEAEMAGENVPARQAMQVVDPVAFWYCPCEHARQPVPEPGLDVNVPAEQAMQVSTFVAPILVE
jgi:hypothetical protein